MTKTEAGLLPALLKYWRSNRGLSQLDLSLAADVSARHVSFLETGRAKPSKEMLLKLASVLQVPLREQNRLLDAAGFSAEYTEPDIQDVLQGPLGKVIQMMLNNHDPYPMVVMDWTFNVVNLNRSALLLFNYIQPELMTSGQPLNAYRAIFDPDQARPFILEWEATAKLFLAGLYRISLLHPHDDRLRQLLESLFTYPEVPTQWQQPDLQQGGEPTLSVKLKKDDLELGFITTQVHFNAPQNVTVEELRIESYLPMNDQTDQFLRTLCQ